MRRSVIHNLDKAIFELSHPEEERIVVTFDLGKFSMKCLDYEVIKMFVKVKSNYIESLKLDKCLEFMK